MSVLNGRLEEGFVGTRSESVGMVGRVIGGWEGARRSGVEGNSRVSEVEGGDSSWDGCSWKSGSGGRSLGSFGTGFGNGFISF